MLRLMLLHPQKLRRGKARKGDIPRIFRKLFLPDHLIQIVRLLTGSPVIPQNGRTDDSVFLIKNHQPVHLPSEADALHF